MGCTILVPTYNDSEFLEKNLRSCISQQSPKEIIVIDDCSTKPFPAKVKDLIAKNDIKVIRHEKNSGLSACRNTGIPAAKYEYILPLDADDWLYPGVMQAMLTFLDEHPDVDVAYGNLTQDSNQVHYPVRGRFTKESFIGGNPLFGTSMFRKRVWKAEQPEYPLDGKYVVRDHAHYEDYNFWAKAFRNGFKFKYIDLLVYNHTLRADSMLMQLHGKTDHFHELAIEGVFE